MCSDVQTMPPYNSLLLRDRVSKGDGKYIELALCVMNIYSDLDSFGRHCWAAVHFVEN